MEKMVLKIFQREIERQCKFAIIAVEQTKTELANDNSDLDLVWYAIQNYLVAVANISKFLWPPKPKYQKGREELRKSLGIKNDSPIKPRGGRNVFEHFDEKLEKWATSSKRHCFIDSNIGPLNAIAGINQQNLIRHFDPTTWTFIFRGDKHELKPMIEAIYDLYPKALTEAGRPIEYTLPDM